MEENGSGRNAENSARKNKKGANTTAGLWFSVVNLSLKRAHGIFQTLSLELKANT